MAKKRPGTPNAKRIQKRVVKKRKQRRPNPAAAGTIPWSTFPPIGIGELLGNFLGGLIGVALSSIDDPDIRNLADRLLRDFQTGHQARNQPETPPRNAHSAISAALRTLTLPPDADASTARRRFIWLAKKYHPDLAPENLKEEYTRKMQEYAAAYQVLKDNGRA